jgi:hypothetical protein
MIATQSEYSFYSWIRTKQQCIWLPFQCGILLYAPSLRLSYIIQMLFHRIPFKFSNSRYINLGLCTTINVICTTALYNSCTPS